MTGMIERGRAAVAVALAGVVASFAALLWAAARGIPLRGYDEVYFTPVVLSVARGGPLANGFVAQGDTHAFIWHGWLYPILMALAPYAGDVLRFGMATTIVAGLATALFAGLALRGGTRWEGAAAIAAMWAVALYQMGRPEAVSSVLIVAAMLLARGGIDGWRFSLVFVAAMIATALAQPTVAMLLCVAYAILLTATARDWRRLIATLAAVGLAILGGVALAAELNPQIGFLRWIGGLTKQANIISGDYPEPVFVPYYLANVSLPLTLTYLLAVPMAGWLAWRRSGAAPAMAGRRTLVIAGTAAFCWIIWFLSVRTAHATYLLGLAPVLLVALLAIVREARAGWARPAAQGLLAVSAAAAVMAFGYRSVQAVDSARGGLSAAGFAQGVAVLRGTRERVGADGPLAAIVAQALPGTPVVAWPLPDLVRPSHPPADYHAPPPVWVVKQADTGLAAPRPPPGYAVLVDRYRREAPRLFGLRYARTLKDYAYAILCRVDRCDAMRARIFLPGTGIVAKLTRHPGLVPGVDSHSKCNGWMKTSAGVWKPRHLRGVLL